MKTSKLLCNSKRHTPSAESGNAKIRRSATAELEQQAWQVPADKLFYRIPVTHLTAISKYDDPLKRAFYEIETIKGCWTGLDPNLFVQKYHIKLPTEDEIKAFVARSINEISK